MYLFNDMYVKAWQQWNVRGNVVRSGVDVHKKARWNFLQLQRRLDSNSRSGLFVELKLISRMEKYFAKNLREYLLTGRCNKFYSRDQTHGALTCRDKATSNSHTTSWLGSISTGMRQWHSCCAIPNYTAGSKSTVRGNVTCGAWYERSWSSDWADITMIWDGVSTCNILYMFYCGSSVQVALLDLSWYFIVAASASGLTRLLVVLVTCAGFAEDSTK